MKTFGHSHGARGGKHARRLAYLLTISSLTVWAGAAHAQSEPAEEESGEIVVSGYRYLAEDTSGTTGLPLPIEKVPQSISIVSEDFIKATDVKTLGDVAQYTPGAIFDGNPGGDATVVKLRGFRAGRAIDGLNVGQVTYEPDFATVDRLEIVKGPTSVVYGAADPGGLINLVTKSAHANTPSYVQALGGSWGRWRVEGQFAGALDAAGNIRVIGVAVHEEADSFMDRVDSAKTVLYAGIDAELTPGLTAYVHGGYERYRRTSFDGNPTFADGSSPAVPRSFFLGSGDYDITTPVTRVNGGLDWEASSALSFSVKLNYLRSNTTGEISYGYNLQTNGTVTLSFSRLDRNLQDGFSAGLSSVYKLDDAGLPGSFVTVAANYQSFDSTLAGTISEKPLGRTGNIFSGVESIERIINARTYNPGIGYATYRQLRYLTLSSQASIKVAEPLTLLAGYSWANPEVKTRSGSAAWRDFSGKDQSSLRLAATFEPLAGLNFYLSYSESFQPQLFIDVRGDVLPPLEGKQYEAGVKYVTADRRLLLTGAVFDVTQQNQGRFDQVLGSLDRYLPIGKVRHRGFEVQAVGQIAKGWQANAGFAVLDPKIRQDSNATLVGKTVTFLPRFTASLFTSYEIDNGLMVGGGVRHVGSVDTSYTGTTRDLSAYTLVDLTAGYTFGSWRLQANLKNLFDKHYYVNNYQTLFYGNVVGEPRSFTVSLRKDF